MKHVRHKIVNNVIIRVPKRHWTDYTINDYVNALGKDFDLAMKIREELFPGIAPVITPKWAEEL